MKVHLVDGTFELFRCFFGAPRATVADGREVGAVRGLLQTLAALLRQDDVSHVAVALDQAMAVAPRGPVPAGAGPNRAIAGQHGLAVEAVRALGLVAWPLVKRYEADDALATAAARYRGEAEQVVICTTDKDLLQCVVGERVVVLDRIRKRVTDEAGVRARFGVRPEQIPDYQALVGDPSDGLPGVPGWGGKSAAAVLARYPTLEAIPADAAEWEVEVRGAARLAEALRVRRREVLLHRDLGVLRTDVPLRDSLADLRWEGADRPALEALCAELEDDSVLERMPRWR
ncbi:MAG: 5'-3' exonuclease H3TH domain-containing protein [Planctomycetota bacterium]